VCGTRGTQFWINQKGWKVHKSWSPWTVAGQVAGYITGYSNGIHLATVRGAGHEVPTYRPEAALQLFTSFINDEL
jgi:serine carboxypeptidase-like clade 2